MIAALKGIVDQIGDGWLVLDVGGVGYLVFCSSRTLTALPGVGEKAKLLIDTHVREDHIHLYGFGGQVEREWFRLLQSVQGVGAKVALAILSALDADQLSLAIAAQDHKAVARANGVGPKLATRIVNELKTKAGKAMLASQAPAGKAGVSKAADGLTGDAVSALANLGYSPMDGLSAVSSARRKLGDGADLSAVIKAALRELAP